MIVNVSAKTYHTAKLISYLESPLSVLMFKKESQNCIKLTGILNSKDKKCPRFNAADWMSDKLEVANDDRVG